jgi:uncharacterized membrane protein
MISFVMCCLLACEVSADEGGVSFVANEVGAREIVDLNARLETVGWREVVDPGIGLRREPFFRRGSSEQRIPLLEGYTNLEAQALSDTGLVVGYASRSIGHTEGSLEAFAWQPPDGRTVALGKGADGANGTVAMGVSSDGQVVAGYWLAANPPRMAPCVWENVGGVWQWTPLSTLHDYNPFLLAGRVMVSRDGSKVAACITVETVPGVVTRYVSQLFAWQRQAPGTWERRRLMDKAIRLAGINNLGMVAGTCTVDRQKRACVVNSDGELRLLGVLPGDTVSEAYDLNNQGIVVGLSDDPARVDSGPRAFVWSQGTMSPLKLPQEFTSSVATSINDEGHIGGYVAGEQAEQEPSRTLSFVMCPSRAP